MDDIISIIFYFCGRFTRIKFMMTCKTMQSKFCDSDSWKHITQGEKIDLMRSIAQKNISKIIWFNSVAIINKEDLHDISSWWKAACEKGEVNVAKLLVSKFGYVPNIDNLIPLICELGYAEILTLFTPMMKFTCAEYNIILKSFDIIYSKENFEMLKQFLRIFGDLAESLLKKYLITEAYLYKNYRFALQLLRVIKIDFDNLFTPGAILHCACRDADYEFIFSLIDEFKLEEKYIRLCYDYVIDILYEIENYEDAMILADGQEKKLFKFKELLQDKFPYLANQQYEDDYYFR